MTPDDPGAPSRPFPIVGIGASAGGLEALEMLTSRLSCDSTAFVIVQHLAPGHESLLADILARVTSLKVETASEGVCVEPSTVYVTPPNAEITIDGGTLHLAQLSDRGPHHNIDAFFRSLAADAGPNAIGVVLSGAGADGTAGLRAIKEEGGISFAQEPRSAAHPNMPQSAIDAGSVDFVLDPTGIADELMRLSAHPYVAQKRTGPLFDPEKLHRVFDKLRRAFHVDFATYKLGTIERRIERRMALHKLERLDDYLGVIESSPDELSVLYSDLLIEVTRFFRDRGPFEALKNVVFPRLFEDRAADAPVRIWVPACSSGEEAYSMAISVLEYFDDRRLPPKIQIFGTDIDDQALGRARQGRYPQAIEGDLSAERLQRFFSRQEKSYQVARQVRDLVVFARQNLGSDPPFSRLDLITCRNVLIYLQPQLQRRALRMFHYALNPDGYLLLGSSESVGDATDFFSIVDRKLKLYVKRSIPSAAVFDFAVGTRI